MFLGLPDRDPLVRGTEVRIRILSSFHLQAKIVRKTLILFCDSFITFYLRSGSISQRHGSADPDPDPHQNVMDPQHWNVDSKK
jgi:hypothetical protein